MLFWAQGKELGTQISWCGCVEVSPAEKDPVPLAFRVAFPPSRNAGVLPSLCPTCRKSQQLKKMGCFVLHPLNSGTGFVELTSGCSVSGKAPPWG